MPIEVSIAGVPLPLGAEVEMNIFRIAQEALANAIRHGGAHRIRLALRFDDQVARLTVADDGRGFDVASLSRGFGLTSMRDRAAQLGTVLHVESRPGNGTSVSLTLPLKSGRRRRALRRVAELARRGVQRVSGAAS